VSRARLYEYMRCSRGQEWVGDTPTAALERGRNLTKHVPASFQPCASHQSLHQLPCMLIL
jgi:hypothetical protein